MALQRLKEAAEVAKIELSTSSTTHISLPYFTSVKGEPKHLEMDLNRTRARRQPPGSGAGSTAFHEESEVHSHGLALGTGTVGTGIISAGNGDELPNTSDSASAYPEDPPDDEPKSCGPSPNASKKRNRRRRK